MKGAKSENGDFRNQSKNISHQTQSFPLHPNTPPELGLTERKLVSAVGSGLIEQKKRPRSQIRASSCVDPTVAIISTPPQIKGDLMGWDMSAHSWLDRLDFSATVFVFVNFNPNDFVHSGAFYSLDLHLAHFSVHLVACQSDDAEIDWMKMNSTWIFQK